MALVNNHKSFEQSLRSASPFAALLKPMKNEIHKCCTGKAHGCGTRKNSRSTYSSVSDSGSEVSPTQSVERESVKRTVGQKREKVNTSCESLPKGLQRKDSIKSLKSNKPTDSKPPWHNVYTAKLTTLKVDVGRGGGGAHNENPDRVNKRVTRKSSIHWQELYENAKNQKVYGGLYMHRPANCPTDADDQVKKQHSDMQRRIISVILYMAMG